jgi:predicted xylose isomerase-like sugar epimerase
MNKEQDAAKAIISLLNDNLAEMDVTTINKLGQARQRAVSAHALSAQSLRGMHQGGVLRLLGSYFHHHLAVSAVLLCGLILLTVLTAQQFSVSSTSDPEIEQSDGFLLASDLPPEAYVDRGFDQWLEKTSF